jgi:hypothetical protein
MGVQVGLDLMERKKRQLGLDLADGSTCCLYLCHPWENVLQRARPDQLGRKVPPDAAEKYTGKENREAKRSLGTVLVRRNQAWTKSML